MARIPNCRGSAGMIDGIKTAQGGGGDRRRSPIAPQTSASTKDVAADELSWFAIEVVE
jgi:hypothetical protein